MGGGGCGRGGGIKGRRNLELTSTFMLDVKLCNLFICFVHQNLCEQEKLVCRVETERQRETERSRGNERWGDRGREREEGEREWREREGERGRKRGRGERARERERERELGCGGIREEEI